MRLTALALLLLSPSAFAAAPADLVIAMDVEPAALIANSVSTVHPQYGGSHPGMFDVRDELGVVLPTLPPTMGMLATNHVDALCEDYDFPPGGDGGDRATLSFALDVPDTARSYAFDFYFLSREYPKWVGDIYNDEFQVEADYGLGPEQIVFDAFGNPVSVNSTLFAVVDPAELEGTCFDQHGGTGWTTTIAPVAPGSVLELMFTIFDRGDGVWASAVLLDNFRFSDDEVDGPTTETPEPDGPLRLSFLSPKEGDVGGGYEVQVHGRGFTADSALFVDGVQLPDEDVSIAASGEVILIASMPPHGEGEVDLRIDRGDESMLLASGFTYWDLTGGERPPHIVGVAPSEASTGGGTELLVRGESIHPDATVVFLTLGEDGDFVATTDALAVESRELAPGEHELYVTAPEHPPGWADLVVVNPAGARSVPGYPVRFGDEVAARIGPPPRGCEGCSVGGGSGNWWLGGLLGLLGLVWRRRGEGARGGPR